MTINIGELEEMEAAVLSAGEQNLANIKRELQDRLAGGLPVDREDPIRHYELYLDALCDVRLGAWRWNSPVAGDSRLVALTAAELDFFAEWHDVVSAVARSVNQRQKDGRGGCNAAKKDALLRFVNEHAADIERLVLAGKRYAAYLHERTEQIVCMFERNTFGTVEKIKALTSEYL